MIRCPLVMCSVQAEVRFSPADDYAYQAANRGICGAVGLKGRGLGNI